VVMIKTRGVIRTPGSEVANSMNDLKLDKLA
jgi:hypothetical protein